MIDAVITYVDASDPSWLKKYMSKVKTPIEDNVTRYRSYDCLDLQVRLIRKFMKFVDNIFIVVDSLSQIEKYSFTKEDNVTIVTHEEIIPKRYLPCFNSCVIEMFFYNIKELKENFVYFNDDVIVVSECSEDDFFENNKPCLNFKEKHIKLEGNDSIFDHNIANSCDLLRRSFPVKRDNGSYVRPSHSIIPLKKSAYTHIWMKCFKEIDKSLTRTRHRRNYNVYLFTNYEYYVRSHVNKKLPMKYYTLQEPIKVYEDIKEGTIKSICLNDVYVIDFNKWKTEFRKMLSCIIGGNEYVAPVKKEPKLIYTPLKVALCAIAKNENLYIREWVKWYKNLGISKIFLYDNNDVCGERFEDVIGDYIDEKFVEIIDRRGITKTVSTDQDGQTTQGLAFKDCYDSHYAEYDWICFFDIDEFLELSEGYNLFSFLNLYKDLQCDGVRVQWVMYGDNNLLYYDDRSVFERFYNKKNRHSSTLIKTILKCKEHHKDNLLFCAHGPLKISGKYKMIDLINADFSQALNPYRNIHKLNPVMPAHLIHFFCKSTEEFISRKWKKSSAVTGINMNRNYDVEFLKDQYFKYNNKSESKLQLFRNLTNERKTSYNDSDDKIIVNFTTWKKRDMYVPFLLKYFQNQTMKPDEIICWLSEDEYNGVIPKSIQQCLDNNMLTKVNFVKGNTYGHKRYETFKYNISAYNILIDDDIYYPIDYIESLYRECKKHPYDVICYYSRHEIYKHNGVRSFTDATEEASFSNRYFSGLAAFSPYLFPVESFKYSDIRDKYCAKCDDSWINAWLFKKNIKIRAIKNWGKISPLEVIGSTQDDGIYETHNGLKVNGVMQAAINIANAVTSIGTQNIAKVLWPEFNINEVTTYKQIKTTRT